MSPIGLVLAYSECGPDVNEEEFNKWYAEHMTSLLTTPGALSGARYKAVDSETPTWLAAYTITSLAVLQTEEYKRVRANISEEEQSIISRISSLIVHFYNQVATYSNPAIPAETKAQYISLIHVKLPAEHEDRYAKWYAEEHIHDIAKIPGWISCQRYTYVGSRYPRGETASDTEVVYNHLAIHYWDNNEFTSTPAFKHAGTNPGTIEMMKLGEGLKARRFGLFKDFAK